MHAPCAHQTKKDRLQEVHVCGGEAGQQMLLVQEAASAQLTCLCGLTIKKKLSDCYASEVKKSFSVVANKNLTILQMPLLYIGVCYKHAEVKIALLWE